jgi:hypothetical protein
MQRRFANGAFCPAQFDRAEAYSSSADNDLEVIGPMLPTGAEVCRPFRSETRGVGAILGLSPQANFWRPFGASDADR